MGERLPVSRNRMFRRQTSKQTLDKVLVLCYTLVTVKEEVKMIEVLKMLLEMLFLLTLIFSPVIMVKILFG
jgi:hypothetical protein